MLQTILTLLVLTACIVYAIARIRKAVHAPSDPCAGCTGCRLREELQRMVTGQWKTSSLPDRWDGRTAERIVQILVS